MDIAAETSLLQSCVSNAALAHRIAASQILRRAKKHASQTPMRIKRIPGEVKCVGWTDASLKSRVDWTSTGGHFIGLAGESILNGERTPVVPVSWRTYKLQRVAVSSLPAEVQARRTMEDDLFMTRLGWSELQCQMVYIHDSDQHVRTVEGTAVLDAKAIDDALTGTT